MKILGGAYAAGRGRDLRRRPARRFGSVARREAAGIALIHQELMLAPNLDIAGNIFLGNERRPMRSVLRLIAPAMKRRSAELLAPRGPRPARRHAGLDADGGADADGGDRQGAVAGRADHHHGRADQLADVRRESQQLFRIIGAARGPRASGSSTSRTGWRKCCSWPTGSRCCATASTSATCRRRGHARRRSSSMMVGRRAVSELFPGDARDAGRHGADVVLEVRDLLVPGAPVGVSFGAPRARSSASRGWSGRGGRS